MYLGRVAEQGPKDPVYDHPRHPYTAALLSAAPAADPDTAAARQRIILTGDVPSPINPPAGCRFHPRCPKAQDLCHQQRTRPRNQARRPPHPPDRLPLSRPAPRKPHHRHHRSRRRRGSHDERHRARVPGTGRGRAGPGDRRPQPVAAHLAAAAQRQVAVASAIVILLMVALAIAAPLFAKLTGHGPTSPSRTSACPPTACPSGLATRSGSAPTSRAVTCSSGSSTGRGSRCSSGSSPPRWPPWPG